MGKLTFLADYRCEEVGCAQRFYDGICDETDPMAVEKLLNWSLFYPGGLAARKSDNASRHLKKAINWGSKIKSVRAILPWFKSFFKSIKKCLDSNILVDNLISLLSDVYYETYDLVYSDRQNSAFTTLTSILAFSLIGYNLFAYALPSIIGFFSTNVQLYLESGFILFGGYLGISLLFGSIGKIFGETLSKMLFKDEYKYFFSSKNLSDLKNNLNVDRYFAERVHYYLLNRKSMITSRACKDKLSDLIKYGLKKAQKPAFEQMIQFLCFEYQLLEIELEHLKSNGIKSNNYKFSKLDTDFQIVARLLAHAVGVGDKGARFQVEPVLLLEVTSLLREGRCFSKKLTPSIDLRAFLQQADDHESLKSVVNPILAPLYDKNREKLKSSSQNQVTVNDIKLVVKPL